MKFGITKRWDAQRASVATAAGEASMSATERVTSAYASKYRLSPAQRAVAGAEISRIVDELKTWPHRVRSTSETTAASVPHDEDAGSGLRVETKPVRSET